jgi:cytochrome c
MNTSSRSFKLIFLVFTAAFFFTSCSNYRQGNPKILIFSKTDGFQHASISAGIDAVTKLGEENGMVVDTTSNAGSFTEENLEQYSAVVFLNTTGDVLNRYQEADFERYIQAGGGYMGIHSAADTEYEWPWYGNLVGGYFLDHPGIHDPYPNVQEGTIRVADSTHPATEFLPDPWVRTDEWYSYRNLNRDVHVLLTLDEDSYQGGADMGAHPIAWYHEFDGGRAFYTGLGHTAESYEEEYFLRHILEGIRYAVGENRKPDYSAVRTHRVPEANRFTKEMLVQGELFEPTEMTILPNLDVLIAQRRGHISLYKHSDSTLVEAGFLDVYHQTDVPGVNAEEGVMGIQADPDFRENRHIFIFYSPADTSVNRLSRFRFENDRINMDSEDVILELYSQRQICCHTGGSIAFDSDGLLYLSTGDNATPFNQANSAYVNNGFAPLDEREGFEQYNALRSSGNANDLRGKILRIRVNEDGSYDIPDGNLYPAGTERTRPEIYVQGNRNPYRISIDRKTGYLYWGEVGPDAANDSLDTRGPRGYDEVNQARAAGNFGWPMFVGPNHPYRQIDYDTGEQIQAYDPERPVNNSRLNTGISELPPAQPAFIWYPYGVSEEFPGVGTGGRNAMTGPVYYTDLYPPASRLPDYFDGKLIIYDWIRNWIRLVTMDSDGNFYRMDPFMEDTDFNGLIDMEAGPDGRLYLLEYGSGWFSQNEDSGLSVINFNGGNRAPVVDELTVDKTSGLLPLRVEAAIKASDPEMDDLTYTWNFGDGTTRETANPVSEHTYREIGDYEISVEVSDGSLSSASKAVSVYAGNEAPQISIEIDGNRTFYFPGKRVDYRVVVTDTDSDVPEDLSQSTLFVSADYFEGSITDAAQGHQVVTDALIGKSLVESGTCQSCHNTDSESIGPSYLEIAEFYRDSSDIDDYLVQKIRQGGSGVWGQVAMPANTELNDADAARIVEWIRSLNGDSGMPESLPPAGSLEPSLGGEPTAGGLLMLSASYTDEGGPGIKPMTGNASHFLRNSTMNFRDAAGLVAYTEMTYEGNRLLMVPRARGSFFLERIDLSDIGSVVITAAVPQGMNTPYQFELRLGSADGPLAGQAEFKPVGSDEMYTPIEFTMNIDDEVDVDNEYDLFFVTQPLADTDDGTLILSAIRFVAKQ